MQIPNQWYRQQASDDIRDHVNRARYASRQKNVHAGAINSLVPSSVHGRALEDGQKDFGSVVGKDDEGETPKASGKVRDGAEDAVEEEKGRVFEGGSRAPPSI